MRRSTRVALFERVRTIAGRAMMLVGIAAAVRAGGAEGPLPESPVPTTEEIALEPPTANPFFFGEIVVVDEKEDPPPGTVDLLEEEAIRASGVVTVGEALQLMPGVSLSVGGRNEQKVWVRGYEQSNVLLLVDGVPISDPYFGDLDLGQLPVFDVARISVARGAASPLYGPNGLGGVINVTTVQGGPPNRVTGELRLTEEHTVLAHAGAGGGTDRVDWFVGLGSETSDGWPLSESFEATEFEDGGARVNSDFDRFSAMGRIGWRASEKGTLHASLRFIDAEKGIPFHTTEPVGFIKFARFPEWRQGTWALGYEHDGEGGRIRGQLYGHTFENSLDVYADPEFEVLRLSSSFSDRVNGGYGVGDWALGNGHRFGAAVHLRQDRHTKTERYPDGSVGPSEDYRAWTWSLAAEDRWRLAPRNQLIGSLALEGLDVRSASSLREIGSEPVLVDDPLVGDVLLSPQLEIRRIFGDRWSGSAALYSRARFPTMRQLYGTDPPNPGLGPQRTTGLDLGVAWTPLRELALRTTVFFNRVDDLITREGRAFPYRNQDEAEIRGVELRLEGQAGAFEYGASWTGLDHRFTRSAEGYRKLPFVPDDQIEVIGVVHLGRRLDLRGVWLFSGSRVAYDRGERIELDRYALLDLGFAGRVGVFELSLRIDNVFDAGVELEPGYPLPGRRVWLGCRFVVSP